MDSSRSSCSSDDFNFPGFLDLDVGAIDVPISLQQDTTPFRAPRSLVTRAPRSVAPAGEVKEAPATPTSHSLGAKRTCDSCQTQSTPMWRKGMRCGESVTLCNACGLRYKKGKYCHYCQKIYYEDEDKRPVDRERKPISGESWIGCAGCLQWVHLSCHHRAVASSGGYVGAACCPNCDRGFEGAEVDDAGEVTEQVLLIGQPSPSSVLKGGVGGGRSSPWGGDASSEGSMGSASARLGKRKPGGDAPDSRPIKLPGGAAALDGGALAGPVMAPLPGGSAESPAVRRAKEKMRALNRERESFVVY